jgi:hypothetical protein
MLVYAGIDEAGYGPMLGPLCVGCSVFVIEDATPQEGPPDLWRLLGAAVCRQRRDRRHRIAIDDSKKLKSANGTKAHPLRHLERGVLCFNAQRHPIPETDAVLLEQLGTQLGTQPWYGSTTNLPLAYQPDELRIAASRLGRALLNAGVRLEDLRCELIDADTFNQQVEQMGRKSNVNFCGAVRLLDEIWRRFPQANAHVVVDRHGGRTHYLHELQPVFPDATIRILQETDAASRYTLERDQSQLTVSFLRQAERAHLPVALASMVAKYLRELGMLRLNRFFISQMPELKPTAGYVEDARRYLAQINPVIEQLGLARSALVRSV